MKFWSDADAVARMAAAFIANDARAGVAARGRFAMAVSGGRTPWAMLRMLAEHDVPWEGMRIFQVDERVAPAGDPERNLTHLRESLIERAPIASAQFHVMPVDAPDLDVAATRYAATLRAIAGSPPVLDLVHLGLGPDGHTASLVPGDPVLDVTDVDVGLTEIYQGRRRMTLTYSLFNRARRVLWVVTGEEKRTRSRDFFCVRATGRFPGTHSAEERVGARGSRSGARSYIAARRIARDRAEAPCVEHQPLRNRQMRSAGRGVVTPSHLRSNSKEFDYHCSRTPALDRIPKILTGSVNSSSENN